MTENDQDIAFLPNDTRIVTCDCCGGDRGFDSTPYGVDPWSGAPLTRWIACPARCDDNGEIEVETELVEMEDF